ncbi:hypothetical protein F5144DRAFT_231060 [Chaetomium tenue]|uniref:Uncharacterized protein n=1 Tax=Chaetomium tenue TaxID=1854479 RepID=A0ACB7P9E8_9PEZI|nr:hypothetical protein F5144DRAFT_231060 [Chaetomium globosum]
MQPDPAPSASPRCRRTDGLSQVVDSSTRGPQSGQPTSLPAQGSPVRHDAPSPTARGPADADATRRRLEHRDRLRTPWRACKLCSNERQRPGRVHACAYTTTRARVAIETSVFSFWALSLLTVHCAVQSNSPLISVDEWMDDWMDGCLLRPSSKHDHEQTQDSPPSRYDDDMQLPGSDCSLRINKSDRGWAPPVPGVTGPCTTPTNPA